LTPSGTEGAAAQPAPPPQARSALADLLASLGIILCVGVADYLTGPDIDLVLFYLAPIGFGTWFIHLRGGLLLSACAALVSIAANAFGHLGGGEAALPVVDLAWNGLMQAGTSVSLVLLLAALHARLEAEERLARTDALTQIANRRAFFETVALEIERTRRHLRPLTAAYVDCDDFKDVNDRRGHAEGDALLVCVAQTLRGATRAIDAVARLGGDEFGLLLPETDAAEAEALLARLQKTLLAAMARHGWAVGFSIGAATFVEPPASADELMANADALMYAAKRERKGSMRLGVFPERGAPRGVA
jgi:diguanylate cyclase (GGDEF)-like protein